MSGGIGLARERCSTTKEAAEKHRNSFLQGLKPSRSGCFTPGLKPRPPKEGEEENSFRKL
jgi:hypothetical protein